ncbi:MAG TPA: alpha-2-macroglobulin family protein [Sedimentibacter sp.]|nr:alpha-2-macroglobulin family protein [Sedimentibacter sp.]
MKKLLCLISLMCLILLSCKKTDVLPGLDTSPVEYGVDDKYELIALKSDKQGIDSTTVFQLTSKEEINNNFIKNNMQIVPEQEYKIEKLSGTTYNIIPAVNLENDKIYQIVLNDEGYEYSWAFQTKKKFVVESTLPTDRSGYVPSNSGIEIYFSLSGLEELDDFFEIKPHVDGKFIYKNNTAIFVPDKLEENINYTVTIKKGYGLKDSEQKLEEDYSFSFNTKKEKYAEIYFDRPLTNIYENNAKIIEAYINNENLEFDINIYQYSNADYFAENINDFAETGKFFTGSVDDIEGLSLLNTIKQKPNISYKNIYNTPKGLFEISGLPKGYYLLEFSTNSSEKNYHFLQINDMLIYYALFENQIVVIASNASDSKGIVDAGVVLNGEHLGFTDNDGILIADRDTSKYENKTISLRVEAKGFSDFVYADSFYFFNYYYRSQYEAYKYIRYIDTDRPVYLPTDKINVWGFARHRDDKSVNKVRIELVEANTGLVLDEKTVDLTNIGTYQTEFEIKNITSDILQINVYDNDLKISTKYVSIGEYTKPLYTVKGEFDKKFVYKGESVNYKVKASFFDGYPVPNLELKFGTFSSNYSGSLEYGGMDTTVKTDEKGETVISVNTNLTSDSWRPVSIRASLWNAKAEDKPVSLIDGFEVFPHHEMVEIVQNDVEHPENISILLHELDITNYDSQYFGGYEKLRGNPLSGTVQVSVAESYYKKVKKGEYYDFINKVNVVDYTYNYVENVVFNEITEITDGYGNLQIPDFNPERTYKISAEYMSENGPVREWAHVGYYSRYYEKLYYSLEKDKDKDNYRLNDIVSLKLTYNHEDVQNTDYDKLILLIMKNGLIDYKITDNTNLSFEFEEEYIPNVMLNSIYYKNGYMYPVEFTGSLLYDTTEKQIHFDVTTDKEEYRPGEEVVLSIKTKDENNKPITADVNISVVDEAYFALFEKRVDTLNSLYARVSSGLVATYLSNIDLSMDNGSGAERGGGGEDYTNFRDEFKDTNVFKTITTDKNGNGELKFKLADNLTSWRITYQGISDKLFAGSGTKNITASLPFFVDVIMSKEYLKDDKISASLRVFGAEAKESEEVNYEIKIINKETGKELKYKETGIIGDYTNISFDKLDEGSYEIYIYASYKDFEDGIMEEFNVLDSFVYFNNTTYYKLTEDTVLDSVYSNPVITLYNESRSDFYKSLENILANSGKRIDQTVCSMLAAKYINDYFKTDLYFNEDELINEVNKYEIDTWGGYSLFTYSAADVEITAKLINLIDNEYIGYKSKTYFKNILQNPDYNEEIPAALWGLSTYKEPVLLTIYDLLENNTLEIRDKIYLSLALAELGDLNTAKKYYKEFSNSFKESGNYLYFESGADENSSSENYELTALLSLLGCKLKDYETSDKLFKYIYNNPSKFTLSSFEQLIYIMNRDIMKLDEIKDLFGEVTVNSEGKDKTYKLKLFDRESFSVPKDKIKDVKFKNIKGSIACMVEALGNKDDLEKNKTDDFSIKIDYSLKDSTQNQMSYNHSDLVKVTIMPSFSKNVITGNYEITYVVPAGFRFIELDRKNPFWVEENGQKLRFFFHYDRQNFAAIPITFYIQAAQKGEYTVDYVVIKENLEPKLNYLDKTILSVK